MMQKGTEDGGRITKNRMGKEHNDRGWRTRSYSCCSVGHVIVTSSVQASPLRLWKHTPHVVDLINVISTRVVQKDFQIVRIGMTNLTGKQRIPDFFHKALSVETRTQNCSSSLRVSFPKSWNGLR